MMAVGDVDRRQALECVGEFVDDRIVGDPPELVPYAVIGGDVDFRCAGGCLRQYGVDCRRAGITTHHGTGLGVNSLDLADAVVFLQGGRQFVFADAVGRIVGERSGGGDAGLAVAAPCEPVDVITGIGIADQNAIRDHAVEILIRLYVDRLVIRIGGRVEIDLGL